ncbi:uncharacterized protein PF3D7_1120000-like [Tiliqua scincoides]|uniref:uncharacterized protein PF3D7_1120000-like n=1 Tax=Tiliqua scincoides TaxID=71010 RepID=UPI003462C55A
MAKKGDKELQLAMESLEKKFNDFMKEMCNKITEKMEEMIDGIKGLIGNLKNEVIQVKAEKKTVNQKVQDMEKKMQELEGKIDTVTTDVKRFEDYMLKLECNAMETCLRLRGVPENLREDVKEDRKEVIRILAAFIDLQPEEMEYQCDMVYRINSQYARQKNLSRDIIVQLPTKRTKEEILRKQYRDPLKVEGTEIGIMKELPRKIMQDRKKYRKLTDKLRGKGVRYRWEIPQRLSFYLKGAWITIKSVREMEDFLVNHNEDLD